MKKRGKTLKWIVIAFVAIVIIGAAIGGNKKDEVTRANSSNESSKQQSEGANAPSDSDAAEELVFAMGETAELKDVQVTMTNVFESQGSDFNKPSDGNTFVLVEFEIINNSNKELAISSLMSFDAYQDGYSTGLSLNALIEKTGEQLDGNIAPGKKMKGAVGYEVPQDYKELEINLQLDFLSSQKIIFKHVK